ncbi:MAG TPA: GspH/FimT family pseudopilin [Thermoanaerobaculia bacterium]|nr:GspH/FimT family pseudopilin [Thermoanaerobaculia bacterium]
MIETLVVLVLAGILAAISAPFIERIIRHERLRSSVREVYSIVLAARMQAVKRNTQVIVKFDLANRTVYSWADGLPYNYTRDAGEDTLSTYRVPEWIYFRQAPDGSGVDSASAVAFDTYNGNPGLVDMIVFRGDGTILTPQSPISGRPQKPGTFTATVPSGSVNCDAGGGRCRGVFMSDQPLTGDTPNRNTFRISVDDFGSSGRASLLKWLSTPEGGNGGEQNYVPAPWNWPV